MLSRVADSLFWLSRYIERADNNARLLREYFQSSLDTETRMESDLRQWEPLLRVSGEIDEFEAHYPDPKTEDVLHYLTFNRGNQHSIFSCIANGRANAHMVRDQLSSGLWEVINLAYHELKGLSKKDNEDEELSELLSYIQDASVQFQGLMDATFPQEDGYQFMQLGRFLERALGTVRTLDLKYHVLLPQGPIDVGGAVDTAQWVSILKACNALEAYHRLYLAEVNSPKVAELLLLKETFPRSLRYCLQSLDHYLRRLTGTHEGQYSNEAEKVSGKMLSDLSYSTIDDIINQGLHEFLVEATVRLDAISTSIFQEYMFLPTIDLNSEIQQQQ